MNAVDLRQGFLVVGRSQKSGSGFTRLHRRQVGDKGLGRLAALRLGRFVRVASRPRSEPRVEYQLSIDWKRFDDAELVESVPIEVECVHTDLKPGTSIEIRELKTRMGRPQIRRLARGLVLLSDPFTETRRAFRPRLISPEFTDFESRVKDSYFGAANYHLEARIDKNGHPTAFVSDPQGKRLFTARRGAFRKEVYSAPQAVFELWTYLLGQSFVRRGASRDEVRGWLEVVGGVHVYYRGLRVYPYGEPGHDWLDMNLGRVRSPEERPSTNNSIGKVVLDDPDGLLLQKTDRSGFVENEAFQELRQFCIDALDWMANERLKAAERRRAEERRRLPQETERAKKRVEEIIATLPPSKRPELEQAYTKLESAQRREADRLRQDLLLYRTLGTVGTTVALFAHEAPRSLDQILAMAKAASQRAAQLVEPSVVSRLEKPLGVIAESARALQSFAQLPRRLLDQSRRRVGILDVNASVQETVEVFADLTKATNVDVSCELVDENPRIYGSKAALDSVVANLLSNSINAFISDTSPRTVGRRVEIQTGLSDSQVTIRVSDSGPGIRGIDLDDMWLPGRTTTERGTGLGLTIVRDTVTDLGGTVTAVGHGLLGGAEFLVQLPRRQ